MLRVDQEETQTKAAPGVAAAGGGRRWRRTGARRRCLLCVSPCQTSPSVAPVAPPSPTGAPCHTAEWIKRKHRQSRTRRGSSRWRRECDGVEGRPPQEMLVLLVRPDQPFCTHRGAPTGALGTVKWIKTRGKTKRTRRGSSRWRREAMASNRGAEEMLVVCVSLSHQPFCCTSRPPLTHRGALRPVKWIKTREERQNAPGVAAAAGGGREAMA